MKNNKEVVISLIIPMATRTKSTVKLRSQDRVHSSTLPSLRKREQGCIGCAHVCVCSVHTGWKPEPDFMRTGFLTKLEACLSLGRLAVKLSESTGLPHHVEPGLAFYMGVRDLKSECFSPREPPQPHLPVGMVKESEYMLV